MNHSQSPNLAGPSRTSNMKSTSSGSWQPLPYIHSGFCIYPYQPDITPPPTPTTSGGDQIPTFRNRFSWSGIRPNDEDGVGTKVNAYEIPLDVGDEFFAFEEYRCSMDEDGRGDLWYRGYVVQAVSLASLAPSASSSSSTSHPSNFPRPEPSVLIGVFPAAVVHVRPGASNDNGELTEAYERAVRLAEEKSRNATSGWVGEMDTVKEEDEAEGYDVSSPQKDVVAVEAQNGNAPYPTPTGRRQSLDAPGGRSLTRANRPKSLVLEHNEEQDMEDGKDQPPLPKLTAGDSTIAGQQYPLVDEIACAIREWYGRLPTYLANREYRLFSTVMQHIDALFLGRRQLLSQTLSGDELIRVRRECVSRLVKCNVAQGLEVIVRSLDDGSVMVVDRERAYTGASWIGGITCYVYQVQLAYIDLIPLDSLFGKSLSLIEPKPQLQAAPPFSLASTKVNGTTGPPVSGTHYHCLLDVHAFIANPCAPGETAELYFSLYNKAESRFVTEEFCLILNHLGTPARDAEQRIGRLRTLFTDLKMEDLAHDIFLVCKIVRNGALKMRSEGGNASRPVAERRRSALYGISEAGHTLRGYTARGGMTATTDNLTDDSFSVTSGFGGHRPGTIDTSYSHNGGSASIIEGRPAFRRPMGCAVLQLPQLSKLLTDGVDKVGTGVEFNVPIFLPKDEATFATLHEDIIFDRNKDYVTSSRAEAIALNLKVFQGSAPQLVREHPSLLVDVPLSARLGFPDVVYPGTSRHDLYIKLWSASFTPAPTSSGGSIRVRKSVIPSSSGDVQVSLEVRTMDGTIIPDVLFAGGAGEPPVAQYHSLVFHHNDRPTFGELLKISLPTREIECHLFLTFRSRGKDKHLNPDPLELEKPFAFAFLPLSTTSSCIKDGDHDLILYRMERNLQPAPNIYFEAPFLSKDEGSFTHVAARNMTPLRDRMMLRSYLCSSVQTQDDTLQTLFSWQDASSDLDELCSTLQLFGFVPEEEIAKFVPAVLDALFGILVSNLGERQEEMDDLVFRSLIKVLAMTSDRRFPNFKSVLDIYIDAQFTYPASSFRLLRAMRSVMSTPSTKDYRAFLKVWHLFFRFIVRSREHDRARGIGLDATSAHLEADFQRQTKAILEEINALMQSTDKTLIGTQTLAVQHYADILSDLAQVFRPLQIAEIVIAFADTLTLAKGSIAIYKLLLLLQVVKNVFETSQSRALLVPAIVRWIKPHLGRYDVHLHTTKDDSQITRDGKRIRWLECNRLAVTVLAMTINKLQEWCVSPLMQEDRNLLAQEEDNIEYCLSLLPSLYLSYNESLSPKTTAALSRQRSSSAVWKATPDVFPISHPFALISQLPPPSLLERHQHAENDGLPHSGTFNCGLAEIAVVIITLVLASTRENIVRYFTEILEIQGISTCSSILISTFEFCKSTINFEAFPKSWLTLSLMSFSSIIKLLNCVASLLESKDHFIPPVSKAEMFDLELWMKIFELLCDFCNLEELALEDQGQQRRRAQWIVVGDLRDEGANLLTRLWNAIGWESESEQGGLRYGGYQTRFTSLADRVLGLCLSSHDAMCETAVEILFSMIYAEYVLDGKFDTIEREIFAKLDRLFSSRSTLSSSSSSTTDPTMRAYFIAQLRAISETSSLGDDLRFAESVQQFLDKVELFIDLLLSLYEIPETTEWKDERALATYRLMLFVEKIGRKDLYVRFIHQLVEINTSAKDWLAAGLAMKLHADLYHWSSPTTTTTTTTITNGNGNGHRDEGDLVDELKVGKIALPAQTNFQRKEALYYHVIDYFAEAEAYEFALELCQELTIQHQRTTYDINKLSELLVHQARLWEKIGQTTRPKPEYFRVAYFGDFSQLNKDKDLIIRGSPWQRYSDFCDSLQAKYPTATIHKSKIPPPESIRLGRDGQSQSVIWVTSVVPEPNKNLTVFKESVNDNIQQYWKYNNIKEFSSCRPFLKDHQETEALLTWTEKTIITTKENLPGILSRSEVVNVRHEQIPPVIMALNEVRNATVSLRKLSKGRNGQPPESKMLGTAINGAIDSPVSGGVKAYRRIFLDGTYLDKHPQDSMEIGELRLAVLEYVRVIQESLSVHRQVCRDVAFHEALKSHFYKSFPEEINLLPRISDSSSLDGSQTYTHTQEGGGVGLGLVNGKDHHYANNDVRPAGTRSSHLPLAPITFNSPRVSTYSEVESSSKNSHSHSKHPTFSVDHGASTNGHGYGSGSGEGNYVLPPLRLGPMDDQTSYNYRSSLISTSTNTAGAAVSGSGNLTPRGSTSTTRHNPSNGAPGTGGTNSNSSPRGSYVPSTTTIRSGKSSNDQQLQQRSSVSVSANESNSPNPSSNGNGNPGLGARALSIVGVSSLGRSNTFKSSSAPAQNQVDERDRESIAETPSTGTGKKEKGLKRFGSLMRRHN